MKTYTHCFSHLGGDVTVETNELGTSLKVTYEDNVLVEESGQCVNWPFLGRLHGAALDAAENKALREAGEAAIRMYLETPKDDE